MNKYTKSMHVTFNFYEKNIKLVFDDL